MSHFTVLVIGDVEEQLAPFDENLEMDEYEKDLVPEEDIKRFTETYTKPAPDRSYAQLTEEEAAENAKLSFDELYDKCGEDWNGGRWRKNEEGEWAKYSTYNPKSKWDWYQLGGRWSGSFFIMKHGAEGGVVGSPGAFGNETGIDQLKVGDIDWEAMRKRGEDEARNYWEKIEKALGGSIPQPTYKWVDMVDENNERWNKLSIDEKRKIYHAQPELKLVKEAQEKEENRELFGFFFSLEDFNCSKEEYIKKHGEEAITPYAIVMNGEWYERGEMGWWGMSSGDKDTESWGNEVACLIAQADKNDIISLVDCHI